MQEEYYPALYRAADAASAEAQNHLLWIHKLNAYLLAIAALTALISTMTWWVAILSLLLFVGSLFLYIYGQHQDFQARWYKARALAESVKTATWRLTMAAEPFTEGTQDANLEKFRKLLIELLKENEGIGAHLGGEWSKQAEITPAMLEALNQPFDVKKATYLEERIRDQREWYSRKSGDNRRASRKYFIVLCVAYGLAVFLLSVRIAWPDAHYLPIEVVAVIASSLIGWKELKRFDELASAYGLTAHELGIIESRYTAVNDQGTLSIFVSDAENAFSREHTQWAARRSQ